MERLISFIFLFLSLVIPTVYAAGSGDGEFDDLAFYGRGISLFRYGAFGSGLYPYRTAIPGAAFEVRVDGIPLQPRSPFGGDLERIPTLVVDSLSVSGNAAVAVATRDSLPDQPLTRIDFLSGVRRRFRFQGVFERKISERGGIRVFGMSDGIRGGETTGGNGYRLYGMTWRRALSRSGVVRVTVTGSRDRNDLFDLDTGKRMGMQESDERLVSADLVGCRIGKKAVFSSTAYMRNGISRFRRYGTGCSFSDDSFGGSANLVIGEPGCRFVLDAFHDTRSLEGQNGVITWRNVVTGVRGESEHTIGSLSFDLNGGLSYSSRYGAGYTAGGEARRQLVNRWIAVLGGSVSREFPGPEHELFPSLTFSDSLCETRLTRFRVVEVETGLKNVSGPFEFGCFGFSGQADVPVLLPRSGIMRMSGPAWYNGGRFILSVSGGDLVRYRGDMKFDFTEGSGAKNIWPRPMMELRARGSLSRSFFADVLKCSLQGKAHAMRWTDGPSNPDGVFVLLDAVISARVSSFLFTYTIENIADRDMRWFDAFGWQGRNSYWGICWSFRN